MFAVIFRCFSSKINKKFKFKNKNFWPLSAWIWLFVCVRTNKSSSMGILTAIDQYHSIFFVCRRKNCIPRLRFLLSEHWTPSFRNGWIIFRFFNPIQLNSPALLSDKRKDKIECERNKINGWRGSFGWPMVIFGLWLATKVDIFDAIFCWLHLDFNFYFLYVSVPDLFGPLLATTLHFYFRSFPNVSSIIINFFVKNLL